MKPHRSARTVHPAHGQIGYLQLPALDLGASAAFYQAVFGWSVSTSQGSFEGPGIIGQLTADLAPATGGPLLWVCADHLYPTLTAVVQHGGRVLGRPQLDGGERHLVEISDPAGNRLGVVTPVVQAQPQTLLAVRDVEASSRWYQELLGLESDHGGPHYERLLGDGELVLQLHQSEVEHHHGRIGDPTAPLGNGVLVWFGEVAGFDQVIDNARRLQAPVVREPHRNPPQGNGPGHREIWISDPDGYTVVIASPDGEAWEVE